MGRHKCILVKPKRPRSPYIFFMKDYRKYLLKTKGSVSFEESSRLCAAKWKHLSAKEKDKYQKLAQKDTARYRREMKALTPQQVRMLKRRRDPCAPVRPLSAYMWFCKAKWKSVAEKHPDKPLTEVTKKLAELWASSSSRVRKRYETMADCDRQCYMVEKERYRSSRNKGRKR